MIIQFLVCLGWWWGVFKMTDQYQLNRFHVSVVFICGFMLGSVLKHAYGIGV